MQEINVSKYTFTLLPAYYYTGNSIPEKKLLKITCLIRQELHKRGFHVKAITSDIGGCNQAMWRDAGIKANR